MAYPVLAEVSLPPVERQGLRRRRREPGVLPPLRPGCVYVFKTQGGYAAYGDRHVDRADRSVVDATEVSVVQLRPTRLEVALAVPSAHADRPFSLLVTFRCRVVRPEAVAAAGLTDLDAILAAYLREDDALDGLGQALPPDREHEFQRLADAQIRAYWAVAALEVPGLEVALASVELPSAAVSEERHALDLVWEDHP